MDLTVHNDPVKVKFRQDILIVQNGLQELVDAGHVESAAEQCTLKHYFTPKDEKYGCCTYAREIFLPKGSVVIGKIHRHQHLNFISKGTFVSEVGLKRAVYVEEDTIWTTVHLTQFDNETELGQIEQEVISPTYEEMGLIGSIEKLLEGEKS